MATIFRSAGGKVTAMVTRIGRRQKAHLYIQEWMEVRGLSDETLGDRIGVARQTIYRWRTEQHRLDPPKLASLSAAMDLEPEDLFRPPSRPSLDAKIKGLSDEEAKEAAEMLDIFVRRAAKRA